MEKHEKERADFEKRRQQQEEIEQSTNRLHGDWAKRGEATEEAQAAAAAKADEVDSSYVVEALDIKNDD